MKFKLNNDYKISLKINYLNMEKYIEQLEKKPILKYTPENILIKRKKWDDYKERLAAAR